MDGKCQVINTNGKWSGTPPSSLRVAGDNACMGGGHPDRNRQEGYRPCYDGRCAGVLFQPDQKHCIAAFASTALPLTLTGGTQSIKLADEEPQDELSALLARIKSGAADRIGKKPI